MGLGLRSFKDVYLLAEGDEFKWGGEMNWIDFRSIANEVIVFAATGLMGMLALFLWKLPKRLDTFEEAISKIDLHIISDEKFHGEVKERFVVHDKLFAMTSGIEIDSDKIRLGLQNFPYPHSKPRRDS